MGLLVTHCKGSVRRLVHTQGIPSFEEGFPVAWGGLR